MSVFAAVTTAEDERGEVVMMFPDAGTLRRVIENLPAKSPTSGETILTARPIDGEEAARIGGTATRPEGVA